MDYFQYILDHLFEIALVVGMLVLVLIVFKKFRRVPLMPDYTLVFHKGLISGEKLNVPGRHGLRFIYHGNKRLGKVTAYSAIPYNIAVVKDIKDTNVQAEKPYEVVKDKKVNKLVHTLTFKRMHSMGIKMYWGDEILSWTNDDDFKIKNDRIYFPESVPFNDVGTHYVVMTSYPYLTRVIEDLYNKFLFHQSINLFSGNMSKLSSIDPVFAHQINMAREEIKKIEAEKRMKQGNIF